MRTALALPDVARVVVVAAPARRTPVAARLRGSRCSDGPARCGLVAGGPTRHASEWHALRVLGPDIEAGEVDVVAIHDGARPLARPRSSRSHRVAREHGGAIPACP